VTLLADIEKLVHHHPEGAAVTDQTTTATAEPENFVADAEEHVKQIMAWGQRFLAEALPAVSGAAAKAQEYAAKLAQYEANPAVKVILDAALSPDHAQQLAAILDGIVKVFGTVEHEIAEHIPAAPAAPEVPAAPIVAGGQPQ
jgi:hypothetical protein